MVSPRYCLTREAVFLSSVRLESISWSESGSKLTRRRTRRGGALAGGWVGAGLVLMGGVPAGRVGRDGAAGALGALVWAAFVAAAGAGAGALAMVTAVGAGAAGAAGA